VSELTPADRDALGAWVSHMLAHGGARPEELVPVQGRLVRWVARGTLPDAGPVFCKVMGFPRFRDRLRYAFRSLPGAHERRLLERLARDGVAVPTPLWSHSSRWAGWIPRLSVLVTRSLDALDAEPTPAAAAAVARRLADRGVFHPDLNRGNFLVLEDGTIAVLDLQSARQRRAPLSARLRRSMAARLLQEYPAVSSAARQLVDAGLLDPAAAAGAARRAVELAREATLRRIRRCWTNSTEFQRRLGIRGTEHRRRSVAGALPPGRWERGGRSLRRLWIGDRTLEVLRGRTPSLLALFENWWWFPGDCSVYIPHSDRSGSMSELEPLLLEGYEEFRRLVTGQHCGPATPSGMPQHEVPARHEP